MHCNLSYVLVYVYLDGNLAAIAGGTVDRACSTPPHKIPHLHILPPPTDTYTQIIC